jgi:hypothetical protein
MLVWPATITGAALVAAALLGLITSPDQGDHPLDDLLSFVAFGFVLALSWQVAKWSVDRVVVTDERMFEVFGILTVEVASIPLGKLTDLTYRRSVLGRMLGYGELVVETPGQQQAITHIDFLPRPDEFYRKLNEIVMDRIGRSPREDAKETGEIPPIRP